MKGRTLSLLFVQALKTIGKSDGIGVCLGDHTVTDVNDLCAFFHMLHRLGKRGIEITPPQRQIVIQEIPCLDNIIFRCRKRFGIEKSCRDIAGSQLESILFGQRT